MFEAISKGEDVHLFPMLHIPQTEAEMLHKAFTFFSCETTPKNRFTRQQLFQVLEHFGFVGYDAATQQQLWQEVITKCKSPAQPDEAAELGDETAFIAYVVPIGNAALAMGGRDPEAHHPVAQALASDEAQRN